MRKNLTNLLQIGKWVASPLIFPTAMRKTLSINEENNNINRYGEGIFGMLSLGILGGLGLDGYLAIKDLAEGNTTKGLIETIPLATNIISGLYEGYHLYKKNHPKKYYNN